MIIQTWGDVLSQSFQGLWLGIAGIVPRLLLSVVIFIIGWVFGVLVGKGIEEIIKAIKVDQALTSIGFDRSLKRAGWNLNSGKFIGELFKWFIIIVFLVAALNVLSLTQVTLFLQQIVLLYLPQVIIAVLILVIAAVIAMAMQNLVVNSAKAGSLHYAKALGTMTKWAILIFAVLAALYQLGIGGPFLQTLFTGIIVALALGFGLAFGLGGQDAARDYLAKIRREMSDDHRM